MQNAPLWFARIATLYALAIFAFLAYLYIAEPLENIARFGVPARLLFVAALVSHPRA